MSLNIIAGGAFCAGAFKNGMFSEAAGTPITELSQWLQLGPSYLDSNRIGLIARIAQKDYTDYPGLNKYRSEVRVNHPLTPWGAPYTYQWEIEFPQNWINYSANSYGIIAQLHDVNAGNVGRRPTFAIETINGMLCFTLSRDSVPLGEIVHQRAITAGMRLRITVQAQWADGTNAPDSLGRFTIYVGNTIVYTLYGRNSWAGDATSEPNPSYLKAGTYQPGPGDTWWQGKAMEMWYGGAVVAAGFVPVDDLRTYMNGMISTYSGAQIPAPP